MPGSKPAKADNKKKMVKSGPKYTDQTDLIYDFDLKKTVGTPADWMMLSFLAWNYVAVGAVLGQYVADLFLYYGFMLVLVLINIAIATVCCSPLLWNQYVKMNMRKTQEKIAIVAGVFGGSMVVTWGVWICTLTWMDLTVVGQWSAPFPILNNWWKEALYFSGVAIMMILGSVAESLWWNVGFDGISGSFAPLRAWGALCAAAGLGWCMTDPLFSGVWSWLWMLMAFLYVFVVYFAAFFVNDIAGLGGSIGLRLGVHVTNLLVFCHVRYQWWGLAAMRHQFGWSPGNLFNLADQTPPSA